MWDCEGNEIKAWRGTRMPKVFDIAVTPNGEYLITIFSDKDIRILNVATNAERVISEEHSITSLSVSGDNKYLIVNLNSQEIHMWDVEGLWEKPLRYKGHRQHKYVIRFYLVGSIAPLLPVAAKFTATSSKGAGPSMLEGQSGYGSTMQDSPKFTSGDYPAATQKYDFVPTLSNNPPFNNKKSNIGLIVWILVPVVVDLDAFTTTIVVSIAFSFIPASLGLEQWLQEMSSEEEETRLQL
ncbi:unnamed protein product [Lactuca saligna]|uniref:Uncharacterized protein n=1 Tax=Lactuca saligna TaxID=75948 RepID=A0AA35ZWD9_LACSI|nr:unnamed protein product [Lactuca saligna]